MGLIYYYISVTTSEGLPLGRMAVSSLSLARPTNAPGVLVLETEDNRYLTRDIRFTVYRVSDNSPRIVTDTVFLLRRVERKYQDGRWLYRITAYSALHLLQRRILAYAAGTAQASKTAPADNLIKAIVREAFYSTGLDGTRGDSIMQIPADTSLAPSVSKSFAWKGVLPTLQEIAQQSLQLGTGLFFDVAEIQGGRLLFSTYTGQRGIDRRQGFSSSPITFSAQNRNLDSITIDEDYSAEANTVYAGGQGEGAAREIVVLLDTQRRTASRLNITEVFIDARNSKSTADVTSEARTRLQEGAPVVSFSGSIVSAPGSRFMDNWDWGGLCISLGRQYSISV